MKTRSFHWRWIVCIGVLFSLVFSLAFLLGAVSAQADDAAPDVPVKLIFIHHSTGENWLQDGYGNLGLTLAENNYFVSDTNYGWGRDGIGDRTDIVNWPEWFGEERNEDILNDLYHESGQNSYYTRLFDDPGGENTVIMFKSCFPNSALEGSPSDGPQPGEYQYSVGSAKYIYNQILQYFSTRPDKLFIVVTAPPLSDSTYAANARAFNNWLVNDWLSDYDGNNVAVFDFYNVLTGDNHHHRYIDGQIEHSYSDGHNTLYYPSGDDHPSSAGSLKATEEFVPLLNVYYNRWASGAPAVQPEVIDEETEDEMEQQEAVTEEDEAAGDSVEEDMGDEPAQTVTSGVIEDFDTLGGSWSCNNYDETRATLKGGVANERTHSGSNALQMQFEFKEDGWVDCGREFEPIQNWSNSQGISFWLYGDSAFDGGIVTVITEGNPFDAPFSVTQSSVNNWSQVQLAWSDFSLAQWAEVQGDQKINPAIVSSMVFTFESYGGVREAEVWIDDIELLTSIEASGSSEESGLEENFEVEPSADEEQAVKDVEEQTSAGMDRSIANSICPFSTFVLPVGAAGMVLFISSKKSRNKTKGR